MDAVTSLTQYQQLTRETPRGLTNCYLLPDDIERLVGEQKLFYLRGNHCLCFYVKRNGFYRLLYHSDGQLVLPTSHEPITCEIIGTAVTPKRDLPHIDLLIRHGFSRVSSASRMVCSLAAPPETLPSAYTMAWAQPSDLERIYTLWNDTFSASEVDLPTRAELAVLIDSHTVLTVRDSSLLGVMRVAIHGTVGHVSNVAVVASRRGQGVGTLLETAALQFFWNAGVTNVQLWVLDHEPRAFNFHTAFGFVRDGRVATQYIRRGE